MISEGDIRTALKAFLVSNCGLPASGVLAGYGNRAATPKGSYAVLTAMLAERTATNVHEEMVDVDGQGEVQGFEDTTYMPSQGHVQMDFYGPEAWTWANLAALYLRDAKACTFLKPYGVQPLYCGDPKNMTGVSGEGQYQPRWVLEAVISYNQSDTMPVDYFTSVDLTTKPEL